MIGIEVSQFSLPVLRMSRCVICEMLNSHIKGMLYRVRWTEYVADRHCFDGVANYSPRSCIHILVNLI